VGLFLACELALANCSVLVLEKSESPDSPLKHLPFGIRGLSAPTIEALDRRGWLSELEIHKRLKNPHKTPAPETGPRRQGGHFAGIPFLDGNIDPAQWPYRLPSSIDTSLISEMAELESILARRAESLGVEIKRGLALTGFQQNPDGITVQAGDQSFRSQWLVGCDGSRSVVRKLGGFEFAGTEPEFTGYSAQVDLADQEKLRLGRNLTETGMYFQSQPGYLVMIEFDGGAGHRSEPPSKDEIQEVLRRVSNTEVALTALHAATTWTDRARQATTYRNQRIFLAGDAAHIHAPLGGQGLNLGLGDAMNLGWKLALTINGNAPKGLLDTYESERLPIGIQVLNWSRAQVAIMKPDPASRALNAIVRDLIETRDGATYFAGRVWGVHTHYDLGNDHPLQGRSVPNFEFQNGTRIAEFMRDGKGILLDFTNDPSLESLAGDFGDRLQYVTGTPKESLGLRVALVRPDGIVAWATDDDPNIEKLERATAQWLMKEPH
jgi:2-polyprenyl-6-methoxyphenol hydroxylase-like FAD-dependent oxidoreductase